MKLAVAPNIGPKHQKPPTMTTIMLRSITTILLFFCWTSLTLAAEPADDAKDPSSPIRVLRPKQFPESLPAERIEIGPGYKPSLARLPNGNLILIFFTWQRTDGYHEYSFLCRSTDDGQTWSGPHRVELQPGRDLLGRENWLSIIDDGTPHGILFTTNHIIRADSQNPTPGTCRATINRSTDGGVTWSQTILPTTWSHTSRNVIQLPDGTLKVGANDVTGGNNRWLISTNAGKDWTESELELPSYTNYAGQRFDYDNEVGFFQESFTYVNQNGELLQWIRLDRNSPMFAMHDEKPTGNDNTDRTIFTKSADGGVSWSDIQDCPGYTGNLESYGQMYPRVMRLQDGRLLMTFTNRSLVPPLGLRAVLSEDGGDTFNFQHDHLIIDEKTAPGWTSGGGFGNTIQLPNGSFISCYSYATTPQGNEHPHVEVVHWKLLDRR